VFLEKVIYDHDKSKSLGTDPWGTQCFILPQSGNEFWACVISGFIREVLVDKNYAFLSYYAASCGNFLPTFRDKLFVFCSSLLISFFLQFVHVLYSTVVFLCLPALNVVFLPRSSAGLGLLPFSCCSLGFICLLNVYCTFFPSSRLAHVDVLLCLVTAPVRSNFFPYGTPLFEAHTLHTTLPVSPKLHGATI
jgi:hypothetical protein